MAGSRQEHSGIVGESRPEVGGRRAAEGITGGARRTGAAKPGTPDHGLARAESDSRAARLVGGNNVGSCRLPTPTRQRSYQRSRQQKSCQKLQTTHVRPPTYGPISRLGEIIAGRGLERYASIGVGRRTCRSDDQGEERTRIPSLFGVVAGKHVEVAGRPRAGRPILLPQAEGSVRSWITRSTTLPT
jgi:hypothetical protein